MQYSAKENLPYIKLTFNKKRRTLLRSATYSFTAVASIMLACTIVGEISNRHLMTERGIRQSTDGCWNIEESVWEQIERQPFSRRSGNGGNHISPPCATSIQRINSFRGLSWKWGLQKKSLTRAVFELILKSKQIHFLLILHFESGFI